MRVALPGLHTRLPHPLAAPGPQSGSILHAASKRAEHGGRCCQCPPGWPAGRPSSLQAPGMRLHSAPVAPRSRSCPCPGLRTLWTTQRPSSFSPKGGPQAQPRGALQPGLYAKAACRVWAGAHAEASGGADAGAGVGLGHVWSAERGWGRGTWVMHGAGSGYAGPPCQQGSAPVTTCYERGIWAPLIAARGEHGACLVPQPTLPYRVGGSSHSAWITSCPPSMRTFSGRAVYHCLHRAAKPGSCTAGCTAYTAVCQLGGTQSCDPGKRQTRLTARCCPTLGSDNQCHPPAAPPSSCLAPTDRCGQTRQPTAGATPGWAAVAAGRAPRAVALLVGSCSAGITRADWRSLHTKGPISSFLQALRVAKSRPPATCLSDIEPAHQSAKLSNNRGQRRDRHNAWNFSPTGGATAAASTARHTPGCSADTPSTELLCCADITVYEVGFAHCYHFTGDLHTATSCMHKKPFHLVPAQLSPHHPPASCALI